MGLIICKDTNEVFSKYKDYLKSKHWKNKRKVVLELKNNTCEYCKTNKNLQVHHTTYKNIGDEKISDLMVLCEECHQATHRLIKETNKIKYVKNYKNKKRNKHKRKPVKLEKTFGIQEQRCIKQSSVCSINDDIKRIELKNKLTSFDKKLLEFCKLEIQLRKTKTTN